MPVLFRSQAPGSRNQSEPPHPQFFDGGEQFGFLGVEGRAAPGEVPGPVREGVGVGAGELFDELRGVAVTNICT